MNKPDLAASQFGAEWYALESLPEQNIRKGDPITEEICERCNVQFVVAISPIPLKPRHFFKAADFR